MIKTTRIGALVFAIMAATASAQEENTATDSTWRESAIARCTAQYSAEQCADPQFLEENFHVDTLEIAHRAAIHRNRQAGKALRELTLQRVCGSSASDNCANDANQSLCVAQLEQACAMLKAEADNCIASAKLGCASTANPGACFDSQSTRCPSLKKQSIAELLAKYPQLTATQKSRLLAAATELDARTSGWWSDLIGWLQSPFQ